jgi:hypothetical protein
MSLKLLPTTSLSVLIKHGDQVRAAFRDTHRTTSEIAVETRRLFEWVHETRLFWHAEAARRDLAPRV